MVILLALLPLILSAEPEEKPPCVGDPLVPVKVTASTSKAGFGPELLIDGRVDTSWQPDADDAHNLWQWVRFDFGREVEITCIDVDNGVRAMPGEDESFCRRARIQNLAIYADGRAGLTFTDNQYNHWFRHAPGHTRGDKSPTPTTSITLRIAAVRPGYALESATGIAEVRFFGRSAAPQAPETGPITCGSRRHFELRDAVLEHCAKSPKRPTAECRQWLDAFVYCPSPEYKRALKWLPIKEDTWSTGRLELGFKSADPPFPQIKATFVRDNGRWKVEDLTCMRGKVPCALAHHLGSDSFDASDPELHPKIGCETLDGRYFGSDGKLIVPKTP